MFDAPTSPLVPTPRGAFPLSARARRDARRLLAATRADGRERAAELCLRQGRLRLGPPQEGGEAATALPVGTCPPGSASVGFFHSHPADGAATNEASVGDVVALAHANARGDYADGVACVAHPDHADMRCYALAAPTRPEDLPALRAAYRDARRATATQIPLTAARVRETRHPLGGGGVGPAAPAAERARP